MSQAECEMLKKMAEVDIRTVNPEDLVDIKDVKIDESFLCLILKKPSCSNRKWKSMLIQVVPCDETHAMSFKVPKDLLSRRKAKLRIYSKEFVSVLKERYCIEPDSGITIKGEYIERLQAVVFRFRCYKQNGFVVLET